MIIIIDNNHLCKLQLKNYKTIQFQQLFFFKIPCVNCYFYNSYFIFLTNTAKKI